MMQRLRTFVVCSRFAWLVLSGIPFPKISGKWYAFFVFGRGKGPTKFEKSWEMVCLLCVWTSERTYHWQEFGGNGRLLTE
jgi:hypothetical protein